MKFLQVVEYATIELERLRHGMGLQPWSVTIRFESLDNEDVAEVSVLPEYHSARITLDPDSVSTRREISGHLKHELYHVLTAEFLAFWTVVKEAVPDEARPALQVLFDASWERMVLDLEESERRGRKGGGTSGTVGEGGC